MLPSMDGTTTPNDAAHDDVTDNRLRLTQPTTEEEQPEVELLIRRSLPSLRRWAHGRLPSAVRNGLDTCDLVQDVALHALRRRDAFEPRHPAAMDAYLRRALINRIRDELRRAGRRPRPTVMPEDVRCNRPSPLMSAIDAETYWRYRRALNRLSPKDRRLIVARIEHGWSHHAIARRFGLPSVPAANMATLRAARRLAEEFARLDQAGRSAAALRFCSDGSR